MATKQKTQQPSMIETFREFKETKNIDRTTLVSVLEESFRNVIAKLFGSDANFDVIVNPDKGDFEIHRNRIVVADGRYPRDGRNIAILGYYNALTEPAEIKVDAEEAKKWLANGAQPSETVKKLFKKTGVID